MGHGHFPVSGSGSGCGCKGSPFSSSHWHSSTSFNALTNSSSSTSSSPAVAKFSHGCKPATADWLIMLASAKDWAVFPSYAPPGPKDLQRLLT